MLVGYRFWSSLQVAIHSGFLPVKICQAYENNRNPSISSAGPFVCIPSSDSSVHPALSGAGAALPLTSLSAGYSKVRVEGTEKVGKALLHSSVSLFSCEDFQLMGCA